MLAVAVLLFVGVVVYLFVDMPCIQPIELQKTGDIVPCGHCNFCLQLRRMDWCFRLSEEQKVSHSSHFLTLTYTDKNLPMYDSGISHLDKSDYQKFQKRLRSFQDRLYEGLTPLRYYSVGEYGEKTSRPHYHSIMFNMLPQTVNSVERIWGKGHVKVGTVTPKSVAYVTSYILTKEIEYGREPPFALMSRKPGLGVSYLTPQMIKFHNYASRDYVSRNGQRSHMPRLFRNKIFSPEERLELRKRQLIQMDEAYEQQVERLKKFHPNVHSYIDERSRYHSDLITTRLNFKI